MPIRSARRPNPALLFDGTDDYVDCGNINYYQYPQTIELLVKPNIPGSSTWSNVIGFSEASTDNNMIMVQVGDTDKFRLAIYTSDFSGWAVSGIQKSVLYHIAVVLVSDTEKYVYLDGNLELNITTSKSYPSNIDTTTLGNYFRNGSLQNFYNGLIDEFRVWSEVRTQTQIQDNMNKELSGQETGLVVYYKMNKASGGTIYDATGNGNDGTINGARWSWSKPSKGVNVA